MSSEVRTLFEVYWSSTSAGPGSVPYMQGPLASFLTHKEAARFAGLLIRDPQKKVVEIREVKTP